MAENTEIGDSESLLDDFSDLELKDADDGKASLDDIETMLIDINVEPYSDEKKKPLLLEPDKPELFPAPTPRKAKKISIDQKTSGVIPISPKQFKEEVKGPEDKLEVAVNNIKVDPEREKRFQELRDMLARMNREDALKNEWQEPAKEEAKAEEKPKVEEKPKAEEPPKPEPKKEKLRATIKIDAFGSPAHKAHDLKERITKDFSNNLPSIIKTGVMRLLVNNCFEFEKAFLLRAGLSAKYENDFYNLYDFSDKGVKESLESEANLKSQILDELVSKNLKKVSDEEYQANVREGILNAIILGGYEDTLAGKIVYTLPTQSAALKNLLFENNIKLGDVSVVRASFAGFVSLLELEKENPEISAESLEALDWYFEKFDYQKYYAEFVKTMNFYIDINDFDFERVALNYAYHRQNKNERLVFKEIEGGDDADTIQRLAMAKSISHDKMKDVLEDYKFKNNFKKQFLQLDAAEFKGKAFKKLKEIYNFEAGTYAKAVREIKRIRELDNFASFFEAEVGVNYANRPATKYLMVRFGFNGYNNVVVLKLLDGVQPVLAWRGKTGEDSDGFREYFKKAENEIKRHRMMKILDGKFNHEILNSELKWQKVWDFLNWPD